MYISASGELKDRWTSVGFWCSCMVIVSQKDVVELFDLDVNFGI